MKPKSSQGLYPSYSSVSPATIPDPYPTFNAHSQPPPSYSSTFYTAQAPTHADHFATSHHHSHSVHPPHSHHSIPSHHPSIPPSFTPAAQQAYIPTQIDSQPTQQYIPPCTLR
eukprot:NODE_10949_length_482_cov_18.908078_g10295_i0.p1 GENE.NODE_10949_length_482_cov_18.908078_g10295_i0~~NODE_10949_length_482_cov_18.908078_g10295_i0.p1  ORF type:complete len:113 (-),score=23.76 NODE_10949_length_482_cov_18.908078_g10295_i0:5-343(-)